MFLINSTLIICSDDTLEATEELNLFISMNVPFRIEGSQRILTGIKIPERYQRLNRTVFELIPDEKPLESIEEYNETLNVFGISNVQYSDHFFLLRNHAHIDPDSDCRRA